MSSHIDNAIDTAETSEKVLRGPRDRYFLCISWDSKIFEAVAAANADEARESFLDKHDINPDVVDTGENNYGYYQAKGTGLSSDAPHSITLTADQITSFTGKRVKANFRGWKVICLGLKGFTREDGNKVKDNDLYTVIFDAPVGEKVAKPKIKKSEAVWAKDLEFTG